MSFSGGCILILRGAKLPFNVFGSYSQFFIVIMEQFGLITDMCDVEMKL